MRRWFFALLAALGPAMAPRPAAAGFGGCLGELRAAAQAGGVEAQTFESVMRGVEPNPEILGFAGAQPEFKTPIWDYLAGLVDEERATDGRAMLRKWGPVLAKAQERYGVDAPFVVAVWGVESDFGKAFGSRSIVQSLATLACSNFRASYFRSEFVAALKIVQAGDVDPAQFNGSWAGAFGHTQFMPSTFLNTAVDFDGDGRRDIVASVPDALGSTANYLRKHGWVEGLDWGFEVRLPDGYKGPSGRGRKESMAAWSARGLTRIDGGPLGQGTAGLLLPAGADGPAFLVTRNFDVIYSYNAAESYALAIALLADRLRGRKILSTPWPTNDPGLSRADRREMQSLLIRAGYDLDGKMDGVIGTKTRAAIVNFQGRVGLAPDGRASAGVLKALRGR